MKTAKGSTTFFLVMYFNLMEVDGNDSYMDPR
jgi:hypothetical protein